MFNTLDVVFLSIFHTEIISNKRNRYICYSCHESINLLCKYYIVHTVIQLVTWTLFNRLFSFVTALWSTVNGSFIRKTTFVSLYSSSVYSVAYSRCSNYQRPISTLLILCFYFYTRRKYDEAYCRFPRHQRAALERGKWREWKLFGAEHTCLCFHGLQKCSLLRIKIRRYNKGL